MRAHRRKDRGFALLMSLVLIVLAGVALAGVARRSVSEALDAQSAAEALKRRWAVISITAALQGRAEQLLQAAERGRMPIERGEYEKPPVPELRRRFELAGVSVELIIADEQAKANVNDLYEAHDLAGTLPLVRKLIDDADLPDGRRINPMLRKTAIAVDAQRSVLSQFGSYGQVFDTPDPADLIGPAPGEGLASRLTCWADGGLNIRRASPEAIEAVCRRPLGQIATRALINAIHDDPYRPLVETLKAVALSVDMDEDQAAGLLIDRSACHALWVVTRTPRRAWYDLAIVTNIRAFAAQTPEAAAEPAPPSVLRVWRYTW